MGERDNSTILRGRKYVGHLREPTDPLSPGPKFGMWGEEPGPALDEGNPLDWVAPTTRTARSPSRSSSPAKVMRYGSPDRYSYLSPAVAKAPIEVEFDPYAEGYVTEVDMLPLFKLLDPSTLAGCPRKAAHARAEVFKFIREERQGRVEALGALATQGIELRKHRDTVRRLTGIKSRAEKAIQDTQEEAATRVGESEAAQTVLKSKVSAMEGHMVSIKGQLEGMRELNQRLQSALTAERDAAAVAASLQSRLNGVEAQLASTAAELNAANTQLASLRGVNMKLQDALGQEREVAQRARNAHAEVMEFAKRQQADVAQREVRASLSSTDSAPQARPPSAHSFTLPPVVASEEERSLLQKLRVRLRAPSVTFLCLLAPRCCSPPC